MLRRHSKLSLQRLPFLNQYSTLRWSEEFYCRPQHFQGHLERNPYQKRKNDEWSLTSDFVYEASLGGLEHTVLFGLNYADIERKQALKSSDLRRTGRDINFADPNPSRHVATLDILDPKYVADTSKYTLIDTDFGANNTASKQLGIYLQDQIRVNEEWIAVVGTRFDKFEDENIESKVTS